MREWLMENGFQGKEGQQIPEMTHQVVNSITQRYTELYEKITGDQFVPGSQGDENVLLRIEKNITQFLHTYKNR